jgi:hypothetical protein
MPALVDDTKINEDTYRGEVGDHEMYAHYVSKKDLERAIFEGREATALCGKKWLPRRDPQRFPICGTCKEIMDGLPPGE